MMRVLVCRDQLRSALSETHLQILQRARELPEDDPLRRAVEEVAKRLSIRVLASAKLASYWVYLAELGGAAVPEHCVAVEPPAPSSEQRSGAQIAEQGSGEQRSAQQAEARHEEQPAQQCSAQPQQSSRQQQPRRELVQRPRIEKVGSRPMHFRRTASRELEEEEELEELEEDEE